MTTRIKYVPENNTVAVEFENGLEYNLNLGLSGNQRYDGSSMTDKTVMNQCNTVNCYSVKCSSVQCSNVQCSSKQCSNYKQCVYYYKDYTNKNCDCQCDCDCNCTDCD